MLLPPDYYQEIWSRKKKLLLHSKMLIVVPS
jgi:hypothetical protein